MLHCTVAFDYTLHEHITEEQIVDLVTKLLGVDDVASRCRRLIRFFVSHVKTTRGFRGQGLTHVGARILHAGVSVRVRCFRSAAAVRAGVVTVLTYTAAMVTLKFLFASWRMYSGDTRLTRCDTRLTRDTRLRNVHAPSVVAAVSASDRGLSRCERLECGRTLVARVSHVRRAHVGHVWHYLVVAETLVSCDW